MPASATECRARRQGHRHRPTNSSRQLEPYGTWRLTLLDSARLPFLNDIGDQKPGIGRSSIERVMWIGTFCERLTGRETALAAILVIEVDAAFLDGNHQ